MRKWWKWMRRCCCRWAPSQTGALCQPPMLISTAATSQPPHASVTAGGLRCPDSYEPPLQRPALFSDEDGKSKLVVPVVCRRSGQHPKEDEQAYAPEGDRRETVTGEMVCVRRKVNLDTLRADLQANFACVHWWQCTRAAAERNSLHKRSMVPHKRAALPD